MTAQELADILSKISMLTEHQLRLAYIQGLIVGGLGGFAWGFISNALAVATIGEWQQKRATNRARSQHDN